MANGGGWIPQLDSEEMIFERLLDLIFTPILLVLACPLVLQKLLEMFQGLYRFGGKKLLSCPAPNMCLTIAAWNCASFFIFFYPQFYFGLKLLGPLGIHIRHRPIPISSCCSSSSPLDGHPWRRTAHQAIATAEQPPSARAARMSSADLPGRQQVWELRARPPAHPGRRRPSPSRDGGHQRHAGINPSKVSNGI